MAMNPFEYAQALATAWADGGKDLMRAHEEAGRACVALWTSAVGALSANSFVWPAAGSNETLQATLRNMADPRAWLAGGGEMDEILARMAEGPRLADLWDMERRNARVMHAWMQMRRRSVEHSAVVFQAWMRAGQNFMQAVAPTTDMRAALTQWIDIANKELLETQRSPKFLETQSAVIRASIDLRVAQQELTEHIGKQYGVPTRSELDDVHRSVTELRREVRALRRAASQPVAAPQPSAVRKPMRKNSAPTVRANGETNGREAPAP